MLLLKEASCTFGRQLIPHYAVIDNMQIEQRIGCATLCAHSRYRKLWHGEGLGAKRASRRPLQDCRLKFVSAEKVECVSRGQGGSLVREWFSFGGGRIPSVTGMLCDYMFPMTPPLFPVGSFT